MAEMSPQEWRDVANSSSWAAANPCNLYDTADITIPRRTGVMYKLGGGQTLGLFWPNGGSVAKDSGFFVGTAAQPVEVYDDVNARGKYGDVSEDAMGLPNFSLVCDAAAKGLWFQKQPGNRPKVNGPGVPISAWASLTHGLAKAGVVSQSPAFQPTIQPQATSQQPAKTKPGRNTAAGKILAIGNWDVLPDIFTA